MSRLFLALLIFPLIFISCENDDENQNNNDNNNNISESILGTWKWESFNNTFHYGYIDPVLGNDVIYEIDNYSGPSSDEENYDQYLTFRYDNTLLDHNFYYDTLDYVDTLNYIITGNEILVNDVTLTITEISDTHFNYNLTSLDDTWTHDDTLFFDRFFGSGTLVKSTLPSFVDQDSQNNKSVRRSRSFINRKVGDK